MKHRRVYLQEVMLLITVPQVLELLNELLGLPDVELVLQHLGQDLLSLIKIKTTGLIKYMVSRRKLQRVIQYRNIPCRLI